MDLYEDILLNDFTDCSLTRNQCYDPLKADNRYPVLPRSSVLDDRLLVDARITGRELKNLFRGKWYISAGLNPTFDVFDCQVHEFDDLKDTGGELYDKNDKVIADATFSYRIQVDDKRLSPRLGLKSSY